MPGDLYAGGTEGGPPPRLDRRTLLVPGPGEGWSGTLYPDAGEATIWRPPLSERHESRDGPDASNRPDRQPVDLAALDPDGPAHNRARTGRRARGRARRYAVGNRCTRLWTFTYGGSDRPLWADRARVKRDWHDFARRLPEGTAWVRTLEKHADGHVHIHAAMSYGKGDERRTRHLARLWGHGFVDEAPARQRRPGRNERARECARYVVKYATKAIEDGSLEAGEHGYEVAQGFGPVMQRVRAWSRREAWSELVRAMGGEVPAYEWSSADTEDWRGPPVGFLSW